MRVLWLVLMVLLAAVLSLLLVRAMVWREAHERHLVRVADLAMARGTHLVVDLAAWESETGSTATA